MSEDYPKWIDEYIKAYHQGFTNMSPCSWGPVDVFAVLSFLNGTFLSKLHEAITKVKKQKVPMDEIVKSFPSPSSFRMVIYWAIIEYQGSNPKNKEQFREILEFLIDVLENMAQEDIFIYESNIIHPPEEIDKLLNETKFVKAKKGDARELGKLFNSLASLAFALYRDFFPQESNEAYGPYDTSKKFGNNTILVIKHFPKLKPTELWPQAEKLKHKDVKIFQVYKDVKFKCELIGMHSIYEGDIINNLTAYAVMVDGEYKSDIETVKSLSDYFAELATEYSFLYDGMSKEELKIKVLEWDCYQSFDFFNLAGMDWRPTKEMLEAVKGKEVADRFEADEFPSLEEYTTNPEFEVYWLKDLYK